MRIRERASGLFGLLSRSGSDLEIFSVSFVRLYRNFRDWVTIDEIKGLEVHFVKEGAIVSDESRSSEKFIHGIKVLMAKNFIDNLSEETRKGMVEKASQGIWPSYAPIGYLNADGPNGKRTIVPDPALAPLVRRLYELCATGEHSVEELAVIAHVEHLTRGGPIHKSTVNKILRNRVYSGEFEWRGERYAAVFESIVPRDLWLAAQAAFDRLEAGHGVRQGDLENEHGVRRADRAEITGIGRFAVLRRRPDLMYWLAFDKKDL